jgi:hypothetical protein
MDEFYCETAIKAATWAFQVPDRVKAARILRAATNMEIRYRRYYGVPNRTAISLRTIAAIAKGNEWHRRRGDPWAPLRWC